MADARKDFDRAIAILQDNADKSFVKRILEPDKYPTLDNGDGSYSTHKMAWGKAGDRFVVFPTIMLDDKGKLQDMGNSAWPHALQTGNFIPFDNKDDADWFSQNYKAAWGGKPDNWPQ